MRNPLLVITLLLTVFTGCRNSDEPEPEKVYTTNTVLMYLPWTGTDQSTSGSLTRRLEQNVQSVENAIKEQGGLGTTRLLVYIASTYNNATMFEMKYVNGSCVRDTLKKYYRQSVVTEDGIKTVLNDAYSASPTPNYSMIIGAHGSGWLPKGITPQDGTKVSAPKRAYGGSTRGTQANITELAEGIRKSDIQTLDYICFDDCYMANIETAYDLRYVSDYLIASTSEIMSVGLPYNKVWKYLSSETPDYQKICDEFLTFYQEYEYPYGTLSAINCKETANVVSLMKTINNRYSIDNSKLSEIQKLDGYNETVFYDFYDYVSHLCPDENLCSQVRAKLSDIVVKAVATPFIYTVYYSSTERTFPINTFSGITISDPTLNSMVVEAKIQTNWWKDTH